MKLLANLTEALDVVRVQGSMSARIGSVAIDSRQVKKDGLFIAIRGTSTDGHQYIGQAIAQGASAVLCEELPGDLTEGIAYVVVPNAARAAGLVCSAFYDHPSQQLRLTGVTGTNGKTTTATMLYQLFTGLGYRCGLLSTVHVRIGDEELPATHTTPDPVSLHALLDRMVQAGCSHAFMEVSSHAADQDRVAGLDFAGGVFTNMSHDHLDYHKSFDAYIKAKKKFFDNLAPSSFALINADDRRGEVMIQNCPAQSRRYSMRQLADFKGRIIENSIHGLYMEINGKDFHTSIMGEYNAWNLLAVYGAAVLLGAEPTEALTALSSVPGAPGRFEAVQDPVRRITAVIDYAHTPDALDKVLQTIQNMQRQQGRIFTVVGCGGDRDRTKRPVMGRIAASRSHTAILTSDNPRSEDPEAILQDMTSELDTELRSKVLSISDRRSAIRTAVRLAAEGDVILIAGKGHENYQEIKGVKYPFDDKEIIQETLGLSGPL